MVFAPPVLLPMSFAFTTVVLPGFVGSTLVVLLRFAGSKLVVLSGLPPVRSLPFGGLNLDRLTGP